jgi:hypothetical protein
MAPSHAKTNSEKEVFTFGIIAAATITSLTAMSRVLTEV